MLRSLGKMTWVGVGQDVDDQTRIDIHQAVIALVKAAGRPLSTKEIKQRLTAVRGINEFFQIYANDPLIRLQPGVWGINDRDVPLPRDKQCELVEELVRSLETKQSGIHVSELCSVLPLGGCSPEALLSIATQDQRLNVAQGRYVYLTQWGNPRRETISRSVLTVLETASAPLDLGEIVAMVECRVGRKCERPVISGILQALEAEMDESTKRWSLNKSVIEDADDNGETRVDGGKTH